MGSLLAPLRSLASISTDERRVTLLFTNDLHSHIEPRHPASREYPSEGGFEALAGRIEQIRSEGRETLLVDAGDVVDVRSVWVEQWGGDVEYRWIRDMGYDAVAIGDQEMRMGVEELERLSRQWNPPWIASNLRVEGTPLQSRVEPYRIFEKAGIRIGLFALAPPFYSEVPQLREAGVAYGEPLPWARQMVAFLREERRCDYCICLSHLGFDHEQKPDDLMVAEATPGLDLIIGGHSHTRLDEPHKVGHADGQETWIVQTGSAGLRLGRVDLCRRTVDGVQRVISCVQP